MKVKFDKAIAQIKQPEPTNFLKVALLDKEFAVLFQKNELHQIEKKN